MNDTLQAIYSHIMDDLLITYTQRTDYSDRSREWEQKYTLLREQLDGPRQALLEEIDEASNWRQAAELEALFLAAFDQFTALLRL